MSVGDGTRGELGGLGGVGVGGRRVWRGGGRGRVTWVVCALRVFMGHRFAAAWVRAAFGDG